MRRGLLVGLALLATAACSKEKPTTMITPGARLLFHNGTESLWTICDRGSRVFMSSGGAVTVLPGGCVDGSP